MGSGVVDQLVEHSDLEITIADVDREQPERLMAKYSTDRLEIATIDVTTHDDFVKQLAAIDPRVVANTVGPFYKYAEYVYRACIEAGVDCVDLCDDPEGALDALDLHEEARQAGVTIISGAGDSPGLTNILAKYAAERMNSVKEVNLFWVAPQSDIGRAQLDHAMGMFTNPKQYLDGELVSSREKRTVEFGSPLGAVEVACCDHPEVYTLPHYFDSLTHVRNMGALYPKLPVPLEDLSQLYAFTSEEATLADTNLNSRQAFRDVIQTIKERVMNSWDEEGLEYIYGATQVEVVGEQNGEPITYEFSNIGQDMSGTPRTLATVAKMIVNDAIDAEGAFAPEGCIEPETFIEAFSGGRFAIDEVPQRVTMRFAPTQEGGNR